MAARVASASRGGEDAAVREDDDVRQRVEAIETAMWRDAELARQAAVEPVRQCRPLDCVECGRTSDLGRRWRAVLINFGDLEVGVYCPDCAERALG